MCTSQVYSVTSRRQEILRHASSKFTHRVNVDVAAKRVHVEDETVVDQVHGEPNAEEANADQPQVLGPEQVGEPLVLSLLRVGRL